MIYCIHHEENRWSYPLKQLKVFVTVAQEKSLVVQESGSASQSAVSHSVKELENHTCVRLLDITTREWCLQMQGSSWLCVLSDCWMN
ncbi:helix-turn-helix domain-containing protein [Shigella flexneri]